jgi:hypothetical protein
MNTILTKLNFKSRAIKDEAGNTIGRTKKQPSLEVSLPMPTPVEIQEYLDTPDSPVAKLIAEAVNGLVIGAARDQFDEVIESYGTDDSKTVTVDVLDYDKLTLAYIASIPPTQRGSTALSEEDWNNFYQDYLVTMVAATGKTEDRIAKHINIFKAPAKSKGNKDVLAVLVDQLQIYMASSANIEDNAVCASRITDKFNKWLAEPDAVVAADML